jgi:hypothetical protein
LAREPEVLPFCPPQTPMGSRRLAAWAMARPYVGIPWTMGRQHQEKEQWKKISTDRRRLSHIEDFLKKSHIIMCTGFWFVKACSNNIVLFSRRWKKKHEKRMLSEHNLESYLSTSLFGVV